MNGHTKNRWEKELRKSIMDNIHKNYDIQVN